MCPELNFYTRTAKSGSWSGWILRHRSSPRVWAMASTRNEIEVLARRIARANKGYLRLRSAKGRYYDNVDYREESCSD